MPISIKDRLYFRETTGTLLLHANIARFSPTMVARYPRMESRMFIWCISGRGDLCINGERHEITPKKYLFLPWACKLEYEQDMENPYWLGCLHIIPFRESGSPLDPRVSHYPKDNFADRKLRKDMPWSLLEGVISGTFEGSLALLANYMVELFSNVTGDETTLRTFGRLLVQEIALREKARLANRGPLPEALQRIEEYITTHLATLFSVEELAKQGHCSVATVHRLFEQHHHTSPYKYVSGQRMEHAKDLLIRTSFPLGLIAREVGFQDQFHFSRFFKRQSGLPPLRYRQRASMYAPPD